MPGKNLRLSNARVSMVGLESQHSYRGLDQDWGDQRLLLNVTTYNGTAKIARRKADALPATALPSNHHE